MQICCLENPAIQLYCLGDDIGIMDLREYFKIQSNNNNLTIAGILKRIYSHKIYGYAEPISFCGFFLAIEFNLRLLKHKRKVKNWEWVEACVIANPDFMKELLDLTDEEIEWIIQSSKWTKI